MVFFPLKANADAILIEIIVLPSPLTDDVSSNVLDLEPDLLVLNKNLMLDLKALKDSATEDFGFSKTAKLFFQLFLPTTRMYFRYLQQYEFYYLKPR